MKGTNKEWTLSHLWVLKTYNKVSTKTQQQHHRGTNLDNWVGEEVKGKGDCNEYNGMGDVSELFLLKSH